MVDQAPFRFKNNVRQPSSFTFFMSRNRLRQSLSLIYRITISLSIYLLDSICLLLSKSPVDKTNTVLIVRLDNIADFVLWCPSAKQLRIQYPAVQYRIVLAANKSWAPLAETQQTQPADWQWGEGCLIPTTNYCWIQLPHLTEEKLPQRQINLGGCALKCMQGRLGQS